MRLHSLGYPSPHIQAPEEQPSRSFREDESDRAIRAARLLVEPGDSGDSPSALHWMRQPKNTIEGRTPLQMMVTEAAAASSKRCCCKSHEGMFASGSIS